MYRILLVDDEPDILRNLATYFPWEKEGFLVAGQLESGSEALEFLQQQPVEVVLCDIRMPGISGLEFARAVKEMGLPSHIVFLSAYRKFEYAQEAFRYGIRDYLVKPPDFQELLDCLHRIRKELEWETQEKELPYPCASSIEQPKDPVVLTIITYLKGNLEYASLQNAAHIVQMHPNYLSTYFKEKTGISFSEYLNKLRMGKAKQLLTDPQYSVYRVSRIVGYSNVKNFSRAFRSYFGVPPSAVRKGNIPIPPTGEGF
ncbi:MAG: response regulator [Spirochaetales bacterium]